MRHQQLLAILTIKEAEIAKKNQQSCSQSNVISKKVCYVAVTQKFS